MLVDAIVLTGGRSSRLGSVPKCDLVLDGETLLQRTLAAATAARTIVVVGAPGDAPLAAGILVAREERQFSGPASGIAAGLHALAAASLRRSDAALSDAVLSDAAPNDATPSDATLVLACDMPHIALATPLLMAALADNPASDGVIAIDEAGRMQPLAAAYRTGPLAAAIAEHARAGTLESLALFRLIGGLDLVRVTVPRGATADVDTWDDAERLGVMQNQ